MNNTIDIRIIYAFNQAGVRILMINGRYYTIEFFEAGTVTMLKHKLIGKDITDEISTQSQFAAKMVDMNAISSVVLKFADIPKRTLEFHKDIQFVLYA